jgi:lipopolysaccharide cholinephosphotransferase
MSVLITIWVGFMEYRKYLTTDELEHLHKIILEMLLEIERICSKYHINYCLGGGTLLGAVRNHGFIPWDDDADIFMLREDYDKFCKVAPDELDSKYFLQTIESDKGSHYIYTKLRRNDSIYVTDFGNSQEMHHGIFLDIFVHDATANSKLFQKLHIIETKACRAMQVATWTGREYDRRPKLLYGMINFMIRHTSVEFWDKRVRKAFTRYKNKKNALYTYDGAGEHINNGTFPLEWIGKPMYIPFCGHEFPVPKHYDKYLTFLYGKNYMIPPPVEKQVSYHDVVNLKFPEEIN